jgi:hypothetical protein
MATSISFTDDTGFVSITNGFPVPGDRLRGWKPLVSPIGPLHHALGTGVPYKWTHRRDYGAKFDLPYIPDSAQDDCQRLIDWMLTGGIITVTTGDQFTSTYECYLWPGSEPELSGPNPQDLKRTLSLSVLNSEAERMICQYP